MQLQEVIDARQSIRKYKEGEIPDEHIAEMVAAAHKAPSGKNIQNWYYVCIKNDELKQKIADAILVKNEEIAHRMDEADGTGDRLRKFCKHLTLFFLKAPLLTVVFSRTYRPTGYYEMRTAGYPDEIGEELTNRTNPGLQGLGASVENFILKSVDLGYGSCWLTSANYAAEGITEVLKKEIGLESKIDMSEDFGFYMVAMISTGIPEENQKSPLKLPVEKVYTIVK